MFSFFAQLLSNQWPPRPVTPTILDDWKPCLDLSKQTDWGKDEWREYALFLEEEGKKLNKKLVTTKNSLDAARKHLTRRKKTVRTPGTERVETIVGLALKPMPKRGRKKNNDLESVKYAQLAIQKRLELENEGQIVTDKEALEEVCNDLEYKRSKKTAVMGGRRNIFNRMSEIRKQDSQ